MGHRTIMTVPDIQDRRLHYTRGFESNNQSGDIVDQNSRQEVGTSWDIASHWISQNTVMSLAIAVLLGATCGWIQKK